MTKRLINQQLASRRDDFMDPIQGRRVLPMKGNGKLKIFCTYNSFTMIYTKINLMVVVRALP